MSTTKVNQSETNTRKKKSRKLSPTRQEVYLVIRTLGDCDARMIETKLRWRGGSITPRISELVKLGYVEVCYRKQRLDGRTVNYYRITGKTPEFQS